MFKQVTLTNKCLAIVIHRSGDSTVSERHHHHQRQQQHRPSNSSRSSATPATTPENGFRIFQEFQDENRASFWNPGLVQAINSLEFVGFVRPGTLFVSSGELHLECLRGAWARRVLKPPPGFAIKGLGDIGGIEMQEVPQTQFIPLPEVLCLIVSNLNRVGKPATLPEIVTSLTEEYDGMCVPKQEVLYATLGGLIAEGKLYCMGEHYFIPTPTMFHYYQRQFLLRNSGGAAANQAMSAVLWKENEQNLLAVSQKATGTRAQETCSRECQTGASVACGQPPYVPPAPSRKDQATSITNGDKNRLQRPTNLQVNDEKCLSNKENKGFLSRLFGRSKPKQAIKDTTPTNPPPPPHPAAEFPSTSVPHGPSSSRHPAASSAAPMATFSAQFPPPEWLCDPRLIKAVASKELGQQQSQEPFLAKIRRTCKASGNPAIGGGGPALVSSGRDQQQQQRHSVWVDPIDGSGAGGTHNGTKANGGGGNFINRRERTGDETKRYFASQRNHHHHDVNRYHHRQHGGDHLSPNNEYYYDRYYRSGKQQRHRLSKYLSSSSECLRESPRSHSKKIFEAERKLSVRYYHHHDRSRPNPNPTTVQPYPNHPTDHQRSRATRGGAAEGQSTPKVSTPTSPNKRDLGEMQGGGKSNGRPSSAAVVVSRIPPLALPTDAEFDSVSECGGGGRGPGTSTPTPRPQIRLEQVADDITNGPMAGSGSGGTGNEDQTKNHHHIHGGNRDSAYSASPVITEMSSSDGKYSSWSGSDGQRENGGTVAAANSPESAVTTTDEGNRAILVAHDNTYVNHTQMRIRAMDHTYENVDRRTNDVLRHQHNVERDDADGKARLNGTKYEDMSNEDDNKKSSPTMTVSTCVSSV